MSLTNKNKPKESLQMQLDLLSRLKDDCYLRMQTLYNIWKEQRDSNYAQGNRGQLQLLVRLRKTSAHRTPEVSWYKLMNVKTENGNQPRSTYLKRGKNMQYPAITFAKCEAWEKDIVNRIEPELSLARQEYAQLQVAEKALLKLHEILDQEPVPLFDGVNHES